MGLKGAVSKKSGEEGQETGRGSAVPVHLVG